MGGRREEGSGWRTRVYLWWIHVDIWQNQYNNVKLKNKIKKKKSENEVTQSCPTLSDPMDCSHGSSVHGTFQARVLEWGAISFSTGTQEVLNKYPVLSTSPGCLLD